MKYGQVITECNMIKFSFKNHAEHEAGRLVPKLFLFYRKPICEVKASGCSLV